jgi:hypothetical protein
MFFQEKKRAVCTSSRQKVCGTFFFAEQIPTEIVYLDILARLTFSTKWLFAYHLQLNKSFHTMDGMFLFSWPPLSPGPIFDFSLRSFSEGLMNTQHYWNPFTGSTAVAENAGGRGQNESAGKRIIASICVSRLIGRKLKSYIK